MVVTACGSKPGVDGLKESFAGQLAANRFVKGFQRNGDDLTFSAPGTDADVAKWRVHIDSAVVEPNTSNQAAQPYKGTVKSSWYANDRLVRPSGRESNLPVELMANGLSQDCWAFWDQPNKRWSWE
jgi:hypothetical protein